MVEVVEFVEDVVGKDQRKARDLIQGERGAVGPKRVEKEKVEKADGKIGTDDMDMVEKDMDEKEKVEKVEKDNQDDRNMGRRESEARMWPCLLEEEEAGENRVAQPQQVVLGLRDGGLERRFPETG